MEANDINDENHHHQLIITIIKNDFQVKSKRDVRPNDGFLRQLIQWEKDCQSPN